MRKIWNALSLLVVASMIIAACGAPSTSTQPPPVPEAPTTDVTVATKEYFFVAQDAQTLTPQPESTAVTPEAIPAPLADPTIVQVTLTAEEGEFNELIEEFSQLQQQGSVPSSGGKLAMMVALPVPNAMAGVGCDKPAEQIVYHALKLDQLLDPDIKWGGPALATLERLFNGMANGGEITQIHGLAIAADKQTMAVWFTWRDAVLGKSRQIMLILQPGLRNAKETIGSIHPMGEPNVAAVWGSLQEYVARKFGEIIGYNSLNGYYAPGAVVSLSDLAIELIGGAALLGYGYSKLGPAFGQQIKDQLMTWGGCLQRALQKHPRYKEWKAKEQNNKFNTNYVLGVSPNTGVVIFATEEEALQAAQTIAVTTGIVVTTIIVVKFVVAIGTGQYYIILIPTPAG